MTIPRHRLQERTATAGELARADERAMSCCTSASNDGQLTVLSADQREVLGQALSDALSYRTPDGDCTGCDEHPARLCHEHAADLDRTDADLALGREARNRGSDRRVSRDQRGIREAPGARAPAGTRPCEQRRAAEPVAGVTFFSYRRQQESSRKRADGVEVFLPAVLSRPKAAC